MENYLSLLGLNSYESRAYEALLRLDKSTAAKISKMSGVPNGKIYLVLESLIKKHLVDSIPDDPKEFIANDPNLLIPLFESKNNDILKLKMHIQQLKMLYKSEKNTDDSIVLVRQGKKSFQKILSFLNKPKKYEYAIKWNSVFSKEWVKNDKNLIANGVDLKVLLRYDEETKEDILKWLKVHKNIREIKNEGVIMDILDDFEVMITIIGSDSTILIRDKPFAKLMKHMFLETYQNANLISK